MSKKRFPTKILAEISVVVALSVILKDVLPPIFQFPQGGSVTAAGMVPLLWFALRRGWSWGVLAGFVYGLVHMALGGYVVDPVQALLDYPIAFGALGLAGLGRWLKGRIPVNVAAIPGAILTLFSLVVPWWFFNVKLLQTSVLDFTVYPGWFGGNLGSWITAVQLIGNWIGIDPFSSVLNGLKFSLYLLCFGALAAIIGGSLRKHLGRLTIGVGFVLCSLGVFNFYSLWSQLLTSIAMPTAGLRSIEWAGVGLAEARWNWTWGVYLAGFACFLLALAIALHTRMPQIEPGPLIGVGVGILGRFISHFLSGIVFFAIYAPEGMNPAIYSAIYNGSYLIVEFIVSVIIIYIIIKRRLLEIYL